MAYIGKPKFEIQPVIEQMPFKSPAVQSFFTKWCEINDSIQPQIITRNEWDEKRIEGALEKRPDGKQTLFIPEDLQLWEIIGVMEAVDNDAFVAKSERQEKAKEKLLALAKTFQDTGTYIARRVEGIHEGREIANALALEFYEYGQSLASGKRPKAAPDLGQIGSQNLTPLDTETVDRFLSGDILYESRRKRVEQATVENPLKRDELFEAERQKTLAQFFRVAEQAFNLKAKSADGTLRESVTQLKPWQSSAPIHNAFLAKIEKSMTQKIEAPKRELGIAIFRRGLAKLTSEMKERGWKRAVNSFFENLGLDLRIEQKKLIDILRISELKAELEAIRQIGDSEKISQKEREIADRIQNAVSSFPYQSDIDSPTEIIAKQYINCVGASALGGGLMKEAGLNYLVGDVPRHSILFLITSDGKLEWRDMLNSAFNENLTDEIIVGRRQDGLSLTVADIVAFSRDPKPQGLMFDIKNPGYRKKIWWIKEGERQYVTVFEPEYGQQVHLLHNTGVTLKSLGQHEEAIEAYRQAVAINPQYAYPYSGLGSALKSLGRNEEAIEAYRQAVAINPQHTYPYNGLGDVLFSLGRNEEAIEAYRQAVAIDPRDAYPYYGLGNALFNLGRNEEAIEAYRQAVAIDPQDTHPRNKSGSALKSLGRNEEAAEAYKEFIKLADDKKK